MCFKAVFFLPQTHTLRLIRRQRTIISTQSGMCARQFNLHMHLILWRELSFAIPYSLDQQSFPT